MADRVVRVTLSANVRDYSRSIDQAADKTDELRRSAERFAAKNYKAKISVTSDAEHIQDDIERVLEKFNAADAKIKVDADTDEAERAVGHLAEQIQMRIGAAVRAIPDFDLDADVTDAQRGIAEVRADLATLGGKTLGVDIDAARMLRQIAELRSALLALNLKDADIRVKVDAAAAHAELTGLEAHVEKLARGAKLDIDTEKAQRQVSAFTTSMDRRVRAAIAALPNIEIDGDSTPVDRAIRGVRARLQALDGKTIGIDISAADAMVSLDRLEQRLRDIETNSPDVRVQADTGAARRELEAFRAELSRVDGKTATANVRVNDRGTSRQLALIMNSLFALGPAAVTAAAVASGALLALGSTVGILASGVAAAGLAFSGMGGLLKAMGDAELKSGQDAADAAEKRRTATRSVEDARTAVVRAEQDQAQAAKQGARDIVDAKSAVTKAAEDAALANARASDAVKSAAADEAVAHQRVQYALEDLSVARRQAVRDMEDMRERSSDLALDERDAVVRLADARDELANAEGTSATSSRDLEKARIAVARAEDQLSDVQRDRTRQTVDLNSAEKAGIEGSDGVVSARRSVEDAERGATDASKALLSAQQEQTRTERDGSASVASAVQSLADTREQAAQRNQDAAGRVSDSQARLEDAVTAATAQMNEQSTSAKKLAEELSKISPAGEAFANYLYSLKPKLKELQGLAQQGMFPGMEDGIRSLMQIFPNVTHLVDNASKAIGNMARDAGDALNSPFWRTYIDFLSAQAGPVMSEFGRIIGGLIKGLSGMQMAFNPMAQDMLAGMGNMADRFAAWGATLSSNNGFKKFVDYVEQTGPMVIDTLGALGGAIGDIAVAAAPIGPVVLKIIEGLANAIGFIASIPGVGTTLVAIGVGMGALNLAIRAMDIAKVSRLGVFLASVPGLATRAGTGMGAMAVGMGASERAGSRMATVGAKVGTALGKVGTALPIIGIAAIAAGIGFDELSDKSEEAAASVVNGSSNMQKAINDERNSLEKRNAIFGDATDLSELLAGKSASASELEARARSSLNAEMQKNVDALQGEARARGEVALAQAKYDQAVHDFTAGDPYTLSLQQDLINKTNAERDARRQAADATRDQAGALRDLQNDQMASVDAEFGLRQALLNRKEAQQAVTAATADSSTTAEQMERANLSLEQADLQVLRASDALADANLVNAKASNQSSIAAFNHTNTLLGMASGINGTATPAIIDMASKMTDAEIKTHNVTVETQGLDYTVRTLPDGRTVKIATDSAVKETENTANLHKEIDGVPDGEFTLTGVGDIKLGPTIEKALGASSSSVADAISGARKAAGNFATGGILPGYTPGRDVHSFYSPTAGRLNLSGGEAIMRPEFTQAVGPRFVGDANKAARQGGASGVARFLAGGQQGFADGGIFPANGAHSNLSSMIAPLYAGVSSALLQQVTPILANQMQFLTSSGGGPALDWARTQVGKPYGWGAVGPSAYDCSGFMAAIINVMYGRSPHRRLGTTATFPWAGMEPGMGPGLSIGSTKNAGDGNGHMAGTIGGVNVESRGGRGVVVGPEARGAQDRLFNSIYHMPPPAGYNLGAGSFAIEGGGSARAQVQAVAARYGWGAGAEWSALDWLVQHESGWDPNIANPTSSARGLFQKLTSLYGPLEETPAGQAQWGLNYIQGRYGDPLGAQRFWQSHHYYDDGGVASGVGYMAKATAEPERVLSPRQTRAFEQLVDNLVRPRAISALGTGGGSTTVIRNYNLTVQNAGNSTTNLQAQFSRLEAMAGV